MELKSAWEATPSRAEPRRRCNSMFSQREKVNKTKNVDKAIRDTQVVFEILN